MRWCHDLRHSGRLRSERLDGCRQTWRLYGFAFFAGLFIYLAVNLNGRRGIWELVIANKPLLTCTAIGYAMHGGIAGTSNVLIWDGSLTVLLVSP